MTELDIVEGTFKMYKIELRKILGPLKLFIFYKCAKKDRNLRIYYSQSTPKPEANNCEGYAENTSCLVVKPSTERYFTREYLYLKFETTTGCQANMKLIFPKQDLYDEKMKKQTNLHPEGKIPLKAKTKLQ